MTKLEMKKDALALIEELDPSSEYLTEDPDIADKIDSVMNHVMYELARIKKIPKYLEMAVKAGQLVTFAELEKAKKAKAGNLSYQQQCEQYLQEKYDKDHVCRVR